MPGKTKTKSCKHLYKILFNHHNEVYEIYAKHISQDGLYGFVEIEQLVFGERSQLLVDPGSEKLKVEFEGVVRSYIPLHNVIRIDEVEQPGLGKIRRIEDNQGNTNKDAKVTPIRRPILEPIIR